MSRLVGVGRALLGVLICVVMASVVILTLPLGKSDGRLFHALSRFWARAILTVSGISVRVRGLENIAAGESYVYVANHASLLDIPIILASIPDQIRIVYKKELEVLPIFGWGLKWGHYIGIDRRKGAEARKSLEEAAEKIRRGASVLLYAEGTRTLDGKLQPFKRGAFNLALRAGVTVVPLTVNGTFGIMPKHSIRVRPAPVELVLEKPIDTRGEEGKEAELRLMERVHAAIAQHYIPQ
jgi:1-acyl-sn-glycerol-3-phosphate acyltransferase